MSTLDEAEAFLRELAERTTTQSVSTSLVRTSRALRQQVDDTDDKRRAPPAGGPRATEPPPRAIAGWARGRSFGMQ